MKLKLHRLDALGAAHLLLPLLILVGAGIVGSYVAVKSVSHADPTSYTRTVAYNGNDDGCGNNATHYNGLTHVGRKNYGGSKSVCKCNNGKTITYKAVEGNSTNERCNKSSSSGIRAYNGNNDGCGNNATHYNGSTHVGRTHYGSGSVCKCNNDKTISYKAVEGNTTNERCNKSKSSSSGSRVANKASGSCKITASPYYKIGNRKANISIRTRNTGDVAFKPEYSLKKEYLIMGTTQFTFNDVDHSYGDSLKAHQTRTDSDGYQTISSDYDAVRLTYTNHKPVFSCSIRITR